MASASASAAFCSIKEEFADDDDDKNDRDDDVGLNENERERVALKGEHGMAWGYSIRATYCAKVLKFTHFAAGCRTRSGGKISSSQAEPVSAFRVINLDMSQKQNGISSNFSSRNSSQKIFN